METTHDAYEFEPSRRGCGRSKRSSGSRSERRDARRSARSERRALRRADARMRMADEVLRYVLVTALLVILVRPIGVIVGLVWGFKIVRRMYRFELEPGLRRRVVRHELRRSGGGADWHDEVEEVGDLAERMGDDPRAHVARDWARHALDELDASETVSGDDVVRVSELVDDVVDAYEARAERAGVTFRVDVDAEGELQADANRLRALLLDLVGESVRALQDGASGPARIHVEMGENLAGSEVWVRIRDDRADAAEGARGTYGSRPVAGVPGATLETQASPSRGCERVLTLRKSPRPGPDGDEPETRSNGAA